MTNPNKEHFITDAPMFSDAPSGSCDEGVIERAFREGFAAGEFAGGGNAAAYAAKDAWERSDARAALSTSSSTLTPDADCAHRFSWRDTGGRRCSACGADLSTPAIRDQDEQAIRDLRTQEYIEAAEAEIKRLQAESDARADQAFEEAARVAEQVARLWGSVGSAANEAADSIRALKGTPPSAVDSWDARIEEAFQQISRGVVRGYIQPFISRAVYVQIRDCVAVPLADVVSAVEAALLKTQRPAPSSDGHTFPATNPPDFEYPLPDDDLGPIIGGREE